jgi:hypothetical protein
MGTARFLRLACFERQFTVRPATDCLDALNHNEECAKTEDCVDDRIGERHRNAGRSCGFAEIVIERYHQDIEGERDYRSAEQIEKGEAAADQRRQRPSEPIIHHQDAAKRHQDDAPRDRRKAGRIRQLLTLRRLGLEPDHQEGQHEDQEGGHRRFLQRDRHRRRHGPGVNLCRCHRPTPSRFPAGPGVPLAGKSAQAPGSRTRRRPCIRSRNRPTTSLR